MSEGGPESFEARLAAGDPPDVDRTDALHERLFRDAMGALELYTIYLGERLGLYRALAESGAATSSQLVARTGTTERYVREWLEHHAASALAGRHLDTSASTRCRPRARAHLLDAIPS